MDKIQALIVPVLFIALMYFMMIMPQKKKEKKTREMLGALQVGSNITTIGGIFGTVINIKDDEVTIETGIDKTKIKIARWSIKEVAKEAV